MTDDASPLDPLNLLARTFRNDAPEPGHRQLDRSWTHVPNGPNPADTYQRRKPNRTEEKKPVYCNQIKDEKDDDGDGVKYTRVIPERPRKSLLQVHNEKKAAGTLIIQSNMTKPQDQVHGVSKREPFDRERDVLQGGKTGVAQRLQTFASTAPQGLASRFGPAKR